MSQIKKPSAETLPNIVNGAVLFRSPDLENKKLIKKVVSLQELVVLKENTAKKIKALVDSIYGMSPITTEAITKIESKLSPLMYNSVIIKQLIAIANAGAPESGYFGINCSIYQGSDLRNIANGFKNLKSKAENSCENLENLTLSKKYLTNRISELTEMVKKHREIQAKYNQALKVEIQLYATED